MEEGGSQRVVANLANELCSEYKVSILCLWNGSARYPLNPSVDIYKIPEQKGIRVPILRGIVRKIHRYLWCRKMKKQLRPDISVSFLPIPNLSNVLTRQGEKVIVSERADPVVMGRQVYWLEKLVMKKADLVVFQSILVKSYFGSDIGEKSRIILNPVEVPCKASAIRSKKIVNIGRLVPQKNQKLLISAFYEFQKVHPDHLLEIYGTGELEEELKKQIRELHLEDKVTLYGFSQAIHEHIKDAEMFVLSSDFEGLSNALQEAMMMGIACISTKVAGSTEILTPGENGLLVDIGDQKGLTEAMLRLAEDEQLREKIERNAVRTSEQFEVRRIVSQWKELF